MSSGRVSSIRRLGFTAALLSALAYGSFVALDIFGTSMMPTTGTIHSIARSNANRCVLSIVSAQDTISVPIVHRCDVLWRIGDDVAFSMRRGRLTGKPLIMSGSVTLVNGPSLLGRQPVTIPSVP